MCKHFVYVKEGLRLFNILFFLMLVYVVPVILFFIALKFYAYYLSVNNISFLYPFFMTIIGLTATFAGLSFGAASLSAGYKKKEYVRAGEFLFQSSILIFLALSIRYLLWEKLIFESVALSHPVFLSFLEFVALLQYWFGILYALNALFILNKNLFKHNEASLG